MLVRSIAGAMLVSEMPTVAKWNLISIGNESNELVVIEVQWVNVSVEWVIHASDEFMNRFMVH